MTLQDLGAIGELVGGVAIIVSLVYVGIQIRQSTNASKAATAQAFSKQYSDLNQMLVTADTRRVFARGMNGLEALPADERVSFMAVLSSISRTLEAFHFQTLKGGLDKELYEGWLTQYLDLLATKGGSDFWAIRRHQYTGRFVEFLDGRISTHVSRPLFEPERTQAQGSEHDR
ncbi:MAG TPA: hypothetical protein VLA56_01110 [Pseudomonadales bacterium]|nr:hypothetical protein [Pseudomonadales bacterium]